MERPNMPPPPPLLMFPREAVPRLVRAALLATGRTLPEIAAGMGRSGRPPAGDPAQKEHAERSVWHTKRSIDEHVAVRLKLRRSAWDDSRTSNDLQDATSGELRRLRRAGKLVDWGRGRTDIYRLADGHGLEVREPSMSTGERPPDPPEARWRVGGSRTDEDRMDMFVWILRHGAKDNTYKFAMARALIELCGEGDPGERGPLAIGYRTLAGRFLKYYWRQVCVFRIRQHHHPKREAKVVRAILDKWGAEADGRGGRTGGRREVDDFDKLNADDVGDVTDSIMRNVFGSERSKKGVVVPRFQKVRIGRRFEVVKMFYDYDDRRREITVGEDARRFFEKNRAILLDEVTFVWAKYLEAANGGLPGLLAKVEAARTMPRRNAGIMRAAREEFLAGKERCFYCGCLLDRGTIEADHFIPWSFIFDDQMWNIVPSCGCCNGRKGGMLPDEDAYALLVERNGRHAGGAGRISESLGLLDRGGGGWKREMRARYDMCRDYRFGTVSIGELCGRRRGDPCSGRSAAGP